MASRTISTLWTDRAGRVSALKAATLAVAVGPALWLVWLAATAGLGPRPYTEAIHKSGDFAVYFLLAGLAVTPLRQIGGWPRLLIVRRMLGLTAFAYALLHLLLYAADQNWVVGKIASEILLRFYLGIGLAALAGLAALGATSTDAAIRRMGPAWHRLHRLVYLITALALFHYFLQSKIDVTWPVLMTGLFLVLMGVRLMRRSGIEVGPLSLAAMAPLAALATAGIEYLWFLAATSVPAERVLLANLTFDPAIRPAWWILAAGLALALLALLRGGPLESRRSRPRREPGGETAEATQ